jgi:SH3-like domain-containing protein
MSTCRPALLILATTAIAVPGHLRAQSVLDRARKAAQDAANAGSKAVSQEVNRQVNSAVENAAQENVADGSFSAVLSPWVSSDGTKQVQLARYSGSAFVATTSAGRQIILCDARGLLPWQVTFAISNAPPSGAGRGAASSTAGRGGGGAAGGAPLRGAATPTAGGARGGGRGAGAANVGGGGRGGSDAAGAGSGGGDSAGAGSSGRGGSGPNPTDAPSASERDYRFPTAQITLTFPPSGAARPGNPSQGSFHVADISETAVAGGATIRFAQATIPGTKGPQVVDLGVAFKARALPTGQATSGCFAPGTPGAAATSGAQGRGAVATTGRGGAGRDNSIAQPTGGTAAPVANPAVSRGQPTATTPPAAGPAFAAGDVLTPKIDNIKLLKESNDSAAVATTLKKGDELVYLGDDQNGFAHVQSSAAEGWVKKVLLTKHGS